MKIKIRPSVDGMVIVHIGDIIRFEVHGSHLRYPDSLRAIIRNEIDTYRRWGRLDG